MQPSKTTMSVAVIFAALIAFSSQGEFVQGASQLLGLAGCTICPCHIMMVAWTDSAAGRAKGVGIVIVMIDQPCVCQFVCYGVRLMVSGDSAAARGLQLCHT